MSAGVAAPRPERAEREARGARPSDDAAELTLRPRRSRWRAALGLFVLLAGVSAAAAAPWWAPRAMSRLAFFRVRRVELDGVRYAAASELLQRLAVDTTASVWADLDAPAARLRAHPLVADARVERRLPGTLRAYITEKRPVALVAERAAMSVYDARGARLPIEPARVGGVDAPVLPARDTALLRLLGALQSDEPRLYARVSEARRDARARHAPPEVVLSLTSSPVRLAAVAGQPPAATIAVRAMADVTAERLADLLLVEADLARRRARVAELDLRYRDQVIAKLQ